MFRRMFRSELVHHHYLCDGGLNRQHIHWFSASSVDEGNSALHSGVISYAAEDSAF
jgi:hypothetical protein